MSGHVRETVLADSRTRGQRCPRSESARLTPNYKLA